MKTLLVAIILVIYAAVSAFSQTVNFIEANGLKTHYLEWGKGRKTILLIHGLSDSAEIWKEFAPLLAKDFRIIAPDRRGSGKSEKTLDGYDSRTLAVDIEKLFDGLKVEKAIVVAHSFGGNSALTFAKHFPNRVESLILIEGGFWEKREPATLGECPVPIEDDCLISNSIQRGINDFDAEKLYPKIVSPTLLIMSLPKELNKTKLNNEQKENKQYFDKAVAHAENVAKSKLKNGTVAIIKNAQHWTFVDQPKAVAVEIKKFTKQKL